MYSIASLRTGFNGTNAIAGIFTNGSIEKYYVDGTNLYITGSFSFIGDSYKSKTVGMCALNISDGSRVTATLDRTLFNGSVSCIVVSGNFMYVGGDFTSYNGKACTRIAKISLLNGELDATFNTATGFDSEVSTIALDSSGNVFVGGFFSTYKGTVRQYLAKLNGSTAALDTTFNTSNGSADLFVTSIVVDASNNIYIGGPFTTYKGATRGGIAKVNGSTAAVDTTFVPPAPGFNSAVNSILLDGSGSLFVSGDFTAYGATTRQRIAKLNATTAALDTTFDAASGFNNSVNRIVRNSSGDIFAVGVFTTYKGTARQYIAKLSGTNAALNSTFDSSTGFNDRANFLTIDASGNIYVLSSFNGFTTYKGTAVTSVVKLNGSTAALETSFAPDADIRRGALFAAIDAANGRILLGGSDSAYFVGHQSPGVAKLSLITGAVDTAFSTGTGFSGGFATNIVISSTGHAFVCGSFTGYNGTTRQRVVKIDKNTGAIDTTFDTASGFNNTVNTLALDTSGNLYAGGSFTTYKGTGRERLAKLNPSTAALDATFDAASGCNNAVRVIRLDASNNVYAGGDFTTYKATTRNRIVKVNGATAAIDTTFNFNQNLNGAVYDLLLDGAGSLFAAGAFTTFVFSTVGGICKINATTGTQVNEFNPGGGFNTIAYALALDGKGNLLVGGAFTDYSSIPRQCIAKLDATNALLDTTFNSSSGFNFRFFSSSSAQVNSIYVGNSNNLLVFGNFTAYGSSTKNSTFGFALIKQDTAALHPLYAR